MKKLLTSLATFLTLAVFTTAPALAATTTPDKANSGKHLPFVKHNKKVKKHRHAPKVKKH